jgi:hypothetical protein
MPFTARHLDEVLVADGHRGRLYDVELPTGGSDAAACPPPPPP